VDDDVIASSLLVRRRLDSRLLERDNQAIFSDIASNFLDWQLCENVPSLSPYLLASDMV
jgi:hypothetical protein